MRKIPIFCSLLPVELFIAKGYTPVFLTPDKLQLAGSGEHQCVFHENICSYAKAIFDYLAKNKDEFDLIVVPASCDAMKKLFSGISRQISPKKLFIWDFPKGSGGNAVKYYAESLKKLEKHLEPSKREYFESQTLDPLEKSEKIGFVGANSSFEPFELALQKFGARPLFVNQCLSKCRPEEKIVKMIEEGASMELVADEILKSSLCPRNHNSNRIERLANILKEGNVKGVIISSFKFCDFYPFEANALKREFGEGFPILQIEQDLTSKDSGQVRVRTEAFLENIFGKSGGAGTVDKPGDFFAAIDSGSHSTKAVMIDKSGKIIATHLIPTGSSVKNSAKKCLEELISTSGIARSKISAIAATGYGRESIDFADRSITEITCHALGASKLIGGDFKTATIIDIGGQDSKAIKITADGSVLKFVMNDKCAAGTGRFIEVMAHKIGVTMEEFIDLAMHAKEHAAVSNMCSVFAESEVVSLIADGRDKKEIARGIFYSIAQRTASMAKRIEGVPPYFMTGGVARSPAFLKELSLVLGEKIEPVKFPQLAGAYGAALTLI